MELELKHLAPYLPYGVKVQHKTFSEHGEKDILTNISSLHWFDQCVSFDEGSDYYLFDPEPDCEIRLLLRPLSDLTEEIEHNGESFIPASKMITHGFHNTFWYDLEKFNYRYLYAHDIEKLLEWHFDIFNLIPNNLAIDINTIIS